MHRIRKIIQCFDYNYQFETYPALREPSALTKEAVKKITEVCRQNHIQLIPQINLLGHQSWAEKLNNLLRVYPEFDETPHVKMPENKGFNVVTCPWRMPANAVRQTQDMFRFRTSVTPEMKDRFQGMVQTVWSGAKPFMDEFYGRNTDVKTGENTASNTFRAMFDEIDQLSSR